MRHCVRLEEAHLVREALRSDARDRAADQQELPRANLLVKIDGERRDHRAQAARPDLLERKARHPGEMPACVVKERRVLAYVEMPVDIAVRRHDDAAVEVEPAHGATWSTSLPRRWRPSLIRCAAAASESGNTVISGSRKTPEASSAATRSRCRRLRSTFGRSELTSARGDCSARNPAATEARRPPGRSTAKLRSVTSPPAVSNTASQPETSAAKSWLR